MSFTLLSNTNPIAKKIHRCIWCGESIAIGEKHNKSASIYCGDFQDHRWHNECWKASQDYFLEMSGEEEFEPYQFKRGTFNIL